MLNGNTIRLPPLTLATTMRILERAAHRACGGRETWRARWGGIAERGGEAEIRDGTLSYYFPFPFFFFSLQSLHLLGIVSSRSL